MGKMTALCSERFKMSGRLLACGDPSAMLVLNLNNYKIFSRVNAAATNKPSELSH